ncbi:MAG: aminotransferase class V-fold PLP-dependent enzyme [Bacteroidetes bacterium]|nr:aminotransferase class V-fold PLP-dependent enzyme [Bacteroidota bacterium]MBS1541950.1 aminotransferase class V-fold PLP-dependent enzyme [Bacteroidota bacterium]
MKPSAHFGPGPSQIYFTVEDHLRKAFREGIPSLGHRTQAFESIFKNTTENLRTLLGAPADFHVFFAASATEIWERSIQNLVIEKSFHLVNGSFSNRYFEIATLLGKSAEKITAPLGEAFSSDVKVHPDTELIGLTHNETSTGVSLSMDFVNQFRTTHPHSLIVVDAVSSLPYPQFDYTKIDSVFFSVQKGFGLPAGLGVWLVNERCMAKAESLLAQGHRIGTYHSLPFYLQNAKKNQTPETPNVLGIYLLGKVVEDFLRRGIQTIRKETEYKSAILYQILDNHPFLSGFVKDKKTRSQTVIVANTGEKTDWLNNELTKMGIQPGDGYGANKKTQLRFANFPAHSKEQYEWLVDSLEKLKN